MLNLLKTSVSSRTKDETRLRFLDFIVPTGRHVAWQVKRDNLALRGKMARNILCQYLREEWPFSHYPLMKKENTFYSVNEESRQNVPVSKLNAACFNTCTDQASTCLLLWNLADFHPYWTALRHVELTPEIGKFCNVNLADFWRLIYMARCSSIRTKSSKLPLTNIPRCGLVIGFQ